MNSHTPGPWITSEGSGMVRDKNGNPICDTGFGARADSEREANARLISAAPDLLTLLERYSEMYRAFRTKPCGSPGSSVRLLQDAQIALEDTARAALAKARP